MIGLMAVGHLRHPPEDNGTVVVSATLSAMLRAEVRGPVPPARRIGGSPCRRPAGVRRPLALAVTDAVGLNWPSGDPVSTVESPPASRRGWRHETGGLRRCSPARRPLDSTRPATHVRYPGLVLVG